MKWTFIILIFLISCTEKHSNGQLNTIESDSIKVDKTIAMSDNIDSNITLECIQRDLSNSFDFRIKFNRILFQNGDNDSCIIKVYILDKKTQKELDSILITSRFMYENVFKNCDNFRSFITGKNINNEALDNDFGEFIVADLNFDSKDDIAIINDSGGNGGVFYNFYIQGENNTFKLDKYLTDSMVYFPSEMIKNKKMLITYVHAGVCGLGEQKFIYNSTNTWRMISDKIINTCKE
ncbi:MAG: hypothetical protein LC105_05580 [Chitinophagales bacterium]|nr:hypothetical protein [Chitinophagales bacterium]MCZ2393304.1 hypothetical protein [Chitinophagales bacterium]